MFRKMPLILLAVLLFAWIFEPWIPLPVLSFLYGLSLSIKSLLLFVLPLVIFGLLFKTASELSRKATLFLLFIVAMICLSNLGSTLISYFVGMLSYQFDFALEFPSTGTALKENWSLQLPVWIDNSYAMIAAIILGTGISLWKPKLGVYLSIRIQKITDWILKGILALIPFFMLGFFLKMRHDGVLLHIIYNYALVFVLVLVSVYAYIFFLYWLASRNTNRSFFGMLRNMTPAFMGAVGTMSSAVTMPLTLVGVEKNAKNPTLAKSVIPMSVNNHLIGDCFAIPIFAFALMKNYGVAEPSFGIYFIFAIFFVLAKFSVAAVPGGGILVMLPILQQYLHFTSPMLSLITALYVLFDPVITSANVMGNGAFALLTSRLYEALFKRKTK